MNYMTISFKVPKFLAFFRPKKATFIAERRFYARIGQAVFSDDISVLKDRKVYNVGKIKGNLIELKEFPGKKFAKMYFDVD